MKLLKKSNQTTIKRSQRTKKLFKKNKRMTNKRSGGGRELFSSKRMPPDVNDIINSYLDPVYALNSKNPLYKVETCIGNNVILLSKDRHFEKFVKDDAFLLSFRKCIDSDIKTYILENKLHYVDPKDVYADPCKMIVRYLEMMIIVIWHIDGTSVERVYNYEPLSKKFSVYRTVEYFISPDRYVTKELLENNDFYKTLEKNSPINATDEICDNNDMINADIFEKAKKILNTTYNDDYRSNSKEKILYKSEVKDIYICPKHLKRYYEEFLTLKLNRRMIHFLVNTMFDFSGFEKEEDVGRKDYGDSYDNASEVEKEEFKFNHQLSNRRTMKILNVLMINNNGNKDAVITELLINMCLAVSIKNRNIRAKGNSFTMNVVRPYKIGFEHDLVS